MRAVHNLITDVPGLKVGHADDAKLADFMDQQNADTLAAYRRGDFAHVAIPTLNVAQVLR